MKLHGCMLKSDRGKQILCDIMYIWNLKRKKMLIYGNRRMMVARGSEDGANEMLVKGYIFSLIHK